MVRGMWNAVYGMWCVVPVSLVGKIVGEKIS
jgi:hypothetical protein